MIDAIRHYGKILLPPIRGGPAQIRILTLLWLGLIIAPVASDAQRRGGATVTSARHDAEATKRQSERSGRRGGLFNVMPAQGLFRRPYMGFAESYIDRLNASTVRLLPLKQQPTFVAPAALSTNEIGRLELRALAGSRPGAPDRLRRGVILHNALPRTSAGYQAVFGEPITAAARRQMVSASRAAREIKADRYELRSLAAFKAVIRAHPDQVHLILAHNEGGAARTPQGKWLDLRELVKECGRLDALCVVVSCRSADYLQGRGLGIGHDIGIKDAVRIARRVAAIVAAARASRGSGDPPRVLNAPALAERINGMLYRSTVAAYAVVPVRGGSAVLCFLVIACRPGEGERHSCPIASV